MGSSKLGHLRWTPNLSSSERVPLLSISPGVVAGAKDWKQMKPRSFGRPLGANREFPAEVQLELFGANANLNGLGLSRQTPHSPVQSGTWKRRHLWSAVTPVQLNLSFPLFVWPPLVVLDKPIRNNLYCTPLLPILALLALAILACRVSLACLLRPTPLVRDPTVRLGSSSPSTFFAALVIYSISLSLI